MIHAGSPAVMRERARDRLASASLSVLLHAAVIGVLGYGWWSWHQRSHPVPTLAIDATVVDSRALAGAEHRAAPRPAPPQPAPPPPATPAAEDQTVPAPPHPDADAARKAAQEQAQEAERKQQADAARAAAEQAERKVREEAERKAREEQARQARLAEEKRKQEAEQRRRQQEAQQLAQSEDDLRRGIAEDERALAERSGPAMASYRGLIQAKIQSNWIRPTSAREGLDCTLDVTQVPGGQVTNVKLGACNGDAAVRQSIVDAVYRASPLPAPPDPALFARELEIEFKPTD
jgi:colicin import membrane protein